MCVRRALQWMAVFCCVVVLVCCCFADTLLRAEHPGTRRRQRTPPRAFRRPGRCQLAPRAHPLPAGKVVFGLLRHRKGPAVQPRPQEEEEEEAERPHLGGTGPARVRHGELARGRRGGWRFARQSPTAGKPAGILALPRRASHDGAPPRHPHHRRRQRPQGPRVAVPVLPRRRRADELVPGPMRRALDRAEAIGDTGRLGRHRFTVLHLPRLCHPPTQRPRRRTAGRGRQLCRDSVHPGLLHRVYDEKC